RAPQFSLFREIVAAQDDGSTDRPSSRAEVLEGSDLEFYLNKVYFGRGLYGVEAASLGFFGKHASDLDVVEAALLAGLLKAPSTRRRPIPRVPSRAATWCSQPCVAQARSTAPRMAQ